MQIFFTFIKREENKKITKKKEENYNKKITKNELIFN